MAQEAADEGGEEKVINKKAEQIKGAHIDCGGIGHKLIDGPTVYCWVDPGGNSYPIAAGLFLSPCHVQ